VFIGRRYVNAAVKLAAGAKLSGPAVFSCGDADTKSGIVPRTMAASVIVSLARISIVLRNCSLSIYFTLGNIVHRKHARKGIARICADRTRIAAIAGLKLQSPRRAARTGNGHDEMRGRTRVGPRRGVADRRSDGGKRNRPARRAGALSRRAAPAGSDAPPRRLLATIELRPATRA
jgi:hypothetical protein